MTEPPAKRTRRTDAAAMWDTEEIESPKSPRPSNRDRDRRKAHDSDARNGAQGSRRDEDKRWRSRSRDKNERRKDRSRSKERSHRGHDRERDRGDRSEKESGRERDRDRDGYSRREREGSRSRDKQRSSRDYPPSRSERPRRHSRSRSPARNGTGTSTRTRSPAKHPRPDREKPPQRDKEKADEKAAASNGKQERPTIETSIETDAMQVDSKATPDPKPKTNGAPAIPENEDPEDALVRKMMGFSGFKSTKNTKVPGNQIYGVRKEKKTEYRQYMNRVGGFNRPLSPSH